MLVAKYYNNNDIRIERQTKPRISSNEVLLKAIACGICGSDVLEWYRIKNIPRVLGHELTGKIAEVGDDIDAFRVGDRVFVSHHVPCNNCRYCLNGHHTACETLHKTNLDPGGFAEYVRVPNINVKSGTYLLPEGVSYEEGTFIEPLGCVIRGQRLAEIRPNQTVLILGCGVAGLLHIQLAKQMGVERIIATDINEYRLNVAKKFGADYVCNGNEDVPSILRQVNDGRLADRILICTSSLSAVNQSTTSIDRGGKILFFAVPGGTVTIPITDFWRNEITILTSYGASPEDLEKAITLIEGHKINVVDMITHRLGLKDIEKGFRLVSEARESIKVIIEL